MHMRRVTALTAVLTMALSLGLAGCAQKINGTAVMAADASVEKPTTTTKGKPTTTAKAPTTSAKPTETKPAGKIKITTKKKTESNCEILSPEEVAAALGAKPAPTPGCVQTTSDPLVVILLMVTLSDYDGTAREIEVAGNTAYEIKEGNDCSVMIMLTDDPEVITPALLASVTPLDEVDTCGLALKLATAAFNKIPNA
ncbi:DUF3558 domain-containing protein [Umezawaea endophytica]|uniref:DUF3558 domain-containing protein n=1 Tax=Umezawaea endophytica TaxID=1654476 RepID=A0A9X2ZYM6_9PSEU|nr:DUF3558 domain-containing protein [Umezawaea endophytica]MCS7476609.1 DUF3558 domain-containing protein [Umezawaea endophytica]